MCNSYQGLDGDPARGVLTVHRQGVSSNVRGKHPIGCVHVYKTLPESSITHRDSHTELEVGKRKYRYAPSPPLFTPPVPFHPFLYFLSPPLPLLLPCPPLRSGPLKSS